MEAPLAASPSHEAMVEKVIEHMRADLVGWDSDASLDALCRRFHYSKFHFIKLFEGVTGITPHRFIVCLRIQKAKEMLLETDASVTAIALDVGYSSFPTFSRTFIAYVGVTPTMFRRMPRTITADAMQGAIAGFLGRNAAVQAGKALDGTVAGPADGQGIIFIGTFSRGLPQGRPDAGTVMMGPGPFSIPRPKRGRCHLLGAQISLSGPGMPTHAIVPDLVGSAIIEAGDADPVRLLLRPRRPSDPPILTSLPSLLV